MVVVEKVEMMETIFKMGKVFIFVHESIHLANQSISY